MKAWIEGRSASAAAVAWLAVAVSEGEEVVLVGGEAPHGLLAAALAPGDGVALTGFRVASVPPDATGRLAGRRVRHQWR